MLKRYFSSILLGIAERMMRSDAEFEAASQDAPASVVMYTTAWCVDCWRAKQVMDSMKVEYTEIDISNDEEATDFVIRLNRGNRSVPTLVFPDGSVMTEPRTSALVAKLQSLM
jgi:mycoredoxin